MFCNVMHTFFLFFHQTNILIDWNIFGSKYRIVLICFLLPVLQTLAQSLVVLPFVCSVIIVPLLFKQEYNQLNACSDFFQHKLAYMSDASMLCLKIFLLHSKNTQVHHGMFSTGELRLKRLQTQKLIYCSLPSSLLLLFYFLFLPLIAVATIASWYQSCTIKVALLYT